MLNHTEKTTEKGISDVAAKAKNLTENAAQGIGSSLAETAEAAMTSVKTEVENLSKASRKVAAFVGAEVGKRPLTYTLAAAGAGALVGLGLMKAFNRGKNAAH